MEHPYLSYDMVAMVSVPKLGKGADGGNHNDNYCVFSESSWLLMVEMAKVIPN